MQLCLQIFHHFATSSLIKEKHVNVYTFMFYCHFSKGNNFCDFLFASLDNVAFSFKGAYSYKQERICSFLPSRVDPSGKDGQN